MKRMSLVALVVGAVAVLALGVSARPAAAQQPGSAAPAGEELRVALVGLLTEHAHLAALAMQKGYDGDPDFQAIVDELDGNTAAIVTAIRSIFGEQAAQAFERLWRAHISYLVDYTVGLKAGDAAMQRQAKQNLARYVEDIAALLSEALGLPRGALERAFRVHVGQLAGALDEYAAGDYETAYALIGDAHAHMVMTANVLAGAIIARFPERFAARGAEPARRPAKGGGR
jgi:hypothetical protein